MSVSLLISGSDIPESEWKNIPVATENEFEKYWIPKSEELNLEYIPLFQFGIEVDSDSLSDILRELKLLKNTVINNSSNNDYKKLISRIDTLMTDLPEFVGKYRTVFIG